MIENADISHLSGFHTPARARYFFEYTGSNIAAFKTTLQFATQNVLPILTISGGKNLLLAFDEYPGLVVYNNSKGYTLEDTTVTVASGHPIWELAESLEQDHNITLWHRFLGLPGSVGGAVFGNA